MWVRGDKGGRDKEINRETEMKEREGERDGVQYLSKIWGRGELRSVEFSTYLKSYSPPKWIKGGNIPKNNIVRLQVRKSKDKGRVMYGLLS